MIFSIKPLAVGLHKATVYDRLTGKEIETARGASNVEALDVLFAKLRKVKIISPYA